VLPSLEPEAIGQAINAMLADPADLARMRNQALEAARQEFYWEKERTRLIALYQRIFQGSVEEIKHDDLPLPAERDAKSNASV